jgi:beta-lactam-binding protein with PASTA domain
MDENDGNPLTRAWRWWRPLLVSRHLWVRVGGLLAAGVLFVLLLNLALMPLWTRHGAEIRVPEVRQMSADDADDALQAAGLRPEAQPQPFNPNLPADVVVDQTPLPGASVKPGRRVYYYVNARPREMVRVPDVISRSEGVARADLEQGRLIIGEVLVDSTHTPYEGTVTRQTPRGGHQVPIGTRVTLWVSPGLGQDRVTVPDVTGLSPAEARRVIREAGLWVDSPNARGTEVQWQEPRAGTRLREGEEVRIHTTTPPAGAAPPERDDTPTATPRTPQPNRPRTPEPDPRPEPAVPDPPPPATDDDGTKPPAVEEPKPPVEDDDED